MKTKAEFITATLLPYFTGDLEPGYDNSAKLCVYLDPVTEGKCAIGQHMKEGEWQQFQGEVETLLDVYDEIDIFTEEFLNVRLMLMEMQLMQKIHDNFFSRSPSATPMLALSDLEEYVGEPLSELREALTKAMEESKIML